jgi:hypothetical protein
MPLLLNRDGVNLYGGFEARGTHLHFDEEPMVKISTFSLSRNLANLNVK